ncbi:MAG TPA: O-antigen ligase family protein [Opitutaceae bacterium]|nr:O-antigen ligase family protein [Opitutaceae bacterium]
MNIALPPMLAPHRLCQAVAIGTAVAIGLLVPMWGDVKMLTLGIVILGFVGLACLLVLPNRRIWLVCAWAFALPLSLEKVFPIFKSEYPDFRISPLIVSGTDLALYLLIAGLLLEASVFRRKVFHWSAAITPFALLVGWVWVDYYLNWPTGEGVIQVIHWTKMLIFLVVFSSSIRTREELLTVLVTVAAAVLVQAAILGVSYVLKKHVGFSPKAAEASLISVPTSSAEESVITRATGTVGHPNQQAMYHVLFTVPIVALFMVRNWIWRIIVALVLLASLCAIIVTVSRTSWISCSLAGTIIVATAWRYGRINRAGWLGLGVGALFGLILVGSFSPLIVTRITKADEGASLSRVHLALLALEHIGNHPIMGVGPGNFINGKLTISNGIQWQYNAWLPRGQVRTSHFIGNMEVADLEVDNKSYHSSLPAHNKFLLTGAELGLVGLGLFLWYQWRLLRTVLDNLRARDPLLWWVGVALFGAFGATLTEYNLELFYDDKTVLMPLFINALTICFSRIAATATTTGGASA